MPCFAAPELTQHDCSDIWTKVPRKKMNSHKLAVWNTVVLPISKDSVFFVGSGAAIFLGSVTGSFRILRSGAHLLTSCTRRIPAYMMRLRYFRNHDKSTLQSGMHAWAPCTHKNRRFRDAHFCLLKRKGGFLMTEMRNYGKIVLRAKYFLWN